MSQQLDAPPRWSTWNLNHWRQPLLPTDTRRDAWRYLAETASAPASRSSRRPCRRSTCPATASCTARSPGTATGARRSSRSTRRSRSSRSARSAPRGRSAATCSTGRTRGRSPSPGSRCPASSRSPSSRVYGVLDGSALASMHQVVADLLPLFDSPRRRPGHPRRRPQRHDARSKDAALPRPRRGAPGRGPRARPRRGEDPRRRAAAVAGRLPVRRGGRLRAPRDLGQLRARPPLRVAVARRPGDGAHARPGGGRGRPLRPRAARARPRALDRAHAPRSGTRSRSRSRSAGATGRPPATSSRRSCQLGRAEGARARRGGRRHARRRSPASRPTGSRRARADVRRSTCRPEPRASEVTLSIHADGRGRRLARQHAPPAVRHRGRPPRAPPRAQRDGRRPPAPRRRVNGWPRFPLARLEDPANLAAPRRRARPDRDREPRGHASRGRPARGDGAPAATIAGRASDTVEA